MKCDGGGVEKLRRRRDWSVDDFDAVEIRRSKSTKCDGAGVYSAATLLHAKLDACWQAVRRRLDHIV